MILAGYNVDFELIKELQGESGAFTPEVISASYARISRDPRDISELRKEARLQVRKARRSNETIVFGLGHSSVAEHAVFNFDIMGLSRLAVEELEGFRLASYTEKSQRYIKIGKDFVVPDEIAGTSCERDYLDLINDLADEYNRVYGKLVEEGEDEEVAKEDARYLLPLATESQLGMTVNARELEYMISRMASHELAEIRELSRKLADIAGEIAPSLVKYREPADYFRNMYRHPLKNINDAVEKIAQSEEEVRLVSITPEGDDTIAAAIIFSSGNEPFSSVRERVRSMKSEDKKRIIMATLKDIRAYDSVWREFEQVHALFELKVSASCFAQLKRHRMATLTAQHYDYGLGIKIPPSVERSGCADIFISSADRAAEIYKMISNSSAQAASYSLLNGHRRRVLFGADLREIYNFSRLRSDTHAQWEIRSLSERICEIVTDEMPLAAMLLGGKDSFDKLKNDVGAE